MLVMEGYALTLNLLSMGFPRGQCLDRYCSYYTLMILRYSNCHTILFADDTTIYTTGTHLDNMYTH